MNAGQVASSAYAESLWRLHVVRYAVHLRRKHHAQAAAWHARRDALLCASVVPVWRCVRQRMAQRARIRSAPGGSAEAGLTSRNRSRALSGDCEASAGVASDPSLTSRGIDRSMMTGFWADVSCLEPSRVARVECLWLKDECRCQVSSFVQSVQSATQQSVRDLTRWKICNVHNVQRCCKIASLLPFRPRVLNWLRIKPIACSSSRVNVQRENGAEQVYSLRVQLARTLERLGWIAPGRKSHPTLLALTLQVQNLLTSERGSFASSVADAEAGQFSCVDRKLIQGFVALAKACAPGHSRPRS